MDYPEEQIYSEIIDRIKDNAAWFTDEGLPAIEHFDWDRNQYTEQGEQKDYPFPRPAVFIRFGKMAFEGHSANSKRGTIPVLVTLVQDRFADAHDGAESQADFRELLKLKWRLNDLLWNWKGTCFSPLDFTEVETDHDNRNLHIEPLLYETKVTIARKSGVPA